MHVLFFLYIANIRRTQAMPTTHTRNTKIEALNLLNLHDGDFNLVKSRLKIPLNTLRRWPADENNPRLQYNSGQYHHFACIKLELLNNFNYKSALRAPQQQR